MSVISLATFNEIAKIISIRKFGEGIVDNASEILPGVFIGDATAAMDAEERGFTAIVNCCPSDVITNRDYYPEHISYLECGLDDWLTCALPAKAEDFIDHARHVGRKVLIHCTSGINISAMVAAAYYMVDQSCDVVAAVKHCFERRPIILCTDTFTKRLIAFAEQMEMKRLTADIADMESSIIEKKRRIAVLTLDCDYEHLTKEDIKYIYESGHQLVSGVVRGESYPLYKKICVL